MKANRLISGMVDKGAEFLTVDKRAICVHDGLILSFSAVPDRLKDILRADMKSQPKKERAIEAMVGLDQELKLEKYTMCQFGGMDGTPDIDEQGRLSYPEFVPCAHRGACKQEGIGCSQITVRPGVELSKSEVAVLRKIDLEFEEIATVLFLSVKTVKTHFQNIRRKTGKKSKTELAIWAVLRGII
ncbi:MAG: LuxR family transcriptional regulator [Pedobacter sp.]|nr:MAG: LuxR family transcriptional regulator [Pedobacter sp.]